MLERTLFSRHLEDDEVVTVIIHKHWILGIKELIAPSISLLLSLGVLSMTTVQTAFYVVTGWTLVSLLWLTRNFFDYYLDAWIITDMGIIDLEWHGWFHRQAARILYSDVQGVSYEIKGVLGTLLRYGDVSVEKISTGASIALSQVPSPRFVEATILRNMEAYLHTKNLKDAKHVQEILAGLVAEQVQLKGLPGQEKRQANTQLEKNAVSTSTAKKKPSFRSSRIGSQNQ